jgi:hypothetical protein
MTKPKRRLAVIKPEGLEFWQDEQGKAVRAGVLRLGDFAGYPVGSPLWAEPREAIANWTRHGRLPRRAVA